MAHQPLASILFYLGVALLSSATLIFEVSLTRILGIAQGHHFAFFVVSTALLGIGASGTFLMIFGPTEEDKSDRFLVFGPVGFSVFSVLSYLGINWIPFDLVRLSWEPKQIGFLMGAYGILAIPFFFTGLAIGTALKRRAALAGRVYFWDLLGATTGALLPLILYSRVGATGAVILSGFLGLIAALSFWWIIRGFINPFICVTGFLCALGLLSGYWIKPLWYEIQLSPYRGLSVALNYPEALHLSTHWTMISRVDVVDSPSVRFAPGLSLTYSGEIPRQIGFTLDGDHLYAITDESSRDKLRFLEYLPFAAPYFMTAPENVMILEATGGLHVLMAQYFDVPAIEVTERDAKLLEIIQKPTQGIRSRIFSDPRVHVHISDPRSFLESYEGEFDLITLPSLHALGATGIASLGFREDFSLTTQAIETYLRHLSPGGWLEITRYLQPVPVQEGRMAATLIEALEASGFKEPGQHIIALRSWGTMTFLLKRTPVSRDDIRKIKEFSEAMRFDLDYYPGIRSDEVNRYNRFSQPVYYPLIRDLLDREKRQALYDDYPFNILPVSDNRPFFGYVLKPSGLREAYRLVREKWLFFIGGGFLPPIMLIQALVFAFILIVWPIIWKFQKTQYSTIPTSMVSILLYFFLIGVSFMGIEIGMIQQMVLFLGHPVYSVSVVLGALLLFAGLGSLMTSTRDFQLGKGIRFVPMGLSLLIAVEATTFRWGMPLLLGSPLEWRWLISIIMIAPLGILMGMPFPMAITFIKRAGAQSMIPWAWAINGSASVVGAILAVMIAMEFGFFVLFISAATGYAISSFCFSQESIRAK